MLTNPPFLALFHLELSSFPIILFNSKRARILLPWRPVSPRLGCPFFAVSMSRHTYKLCYAAKRGRAEPIRAMFHYHGVPFEDHIFDKDDWPKIKPTSPTGQMPYIEVDDGKLELGQTVTICRYLAKALDPESYFAGSTKPEAAICDMYADTFADLFNNGMYYKYSPEGAKDFMGPLFTNFCSSALPILDKRLKKTGKYLAGQKILWCDVFAVSVISLLEEGVGEMFIEAFEKHPNLVEYYHRMRNTPKLRPYIEENWPEAKVKFD